MEVHLLKKVSSEKLNKILDFCKWLNEAKQCDDVLCAKREEYKHITKVNCDMSHQSNYMSKPSFHHATSNNNNSSQTVPFASTTNIPTAHKQCPKLLNSKYKLLNENKSCLRCRCFFIKYHTANCPNDFPSPATYKSLTQSDTDHVKHGHRKGGAAVGFSNTAATSASAASPSKQLSHPVAAILGMSHNPTAYITPDASRMIGSLDVNNSDGSASASVSEVSLPMAATVMWPLTEVSAMHVPHFFWNCLAYRSNKFLLMFRTLIDHGSSAVLIGEEYVVKLGLCWRRLIEPCAVGLTVEKNRQKVDIEFSDYVKVQLHDLSSYWTSRLVCAIIVSGLCAPTILDLPFLVHNSIVVNAAACFPWLKLLLVHHNFLY